MKASMIGWPLGCLALVLLSGCGGDMAGRAAPEDLTEDATAGADADLAPDLPSPDAPDAPLDAAEDLPEAEDLPLDAPLDLAPEDAAGDLAPPDLAVEDADAAPPCAPDFTASFEEQERDLWALWGRAEEARLGVRRGGGECAGAVARSNAPWLAVSWEEGEVRARVDAALAPAGISRAQVFLLRDDGAPLSAIDVTLRHLPRPAEGAAPRLLFVGIDGVRSDALQVAQAPMIDLLRRHGAWTYEANTQSETVADSSAGWSTLYAGVGATLHGVLDNASAGDRDWSYPTFAWRLRHEHGHAGMMAAQWAPAARALHEPDAFEEILGGDGAQVAAGLSAALRGSPRAVYLTHFDDVDHEGHATGFSPSNPRYVAAIEGVDGFIGELLDAILARPTLASEDWLFVVATDHGGEGTSHGPRDRPNQRIPFVVASARGPVGQFLTRDVQQVDVAPTIFAHFGVTPSPSWRLTGQARAQAPAEVDPAGAPPAQEAQCEDRVDEDGDAQIDCRDGDCAGGAACPEVCADDDLGQRVGTRVAIGSNAEGEARYGLRCARLPAAREVSWRWRAPWAGTFTFSTRGSDFDTVLALYEGPCAVAALPLACNDDTGGLTSQVRATVAAGAELSVVVAGFDGEVGRYVLDITASAPGDARPSAGCGAPAAEATGGVQVQRAYGAEAGGERGYFLSVPAGYDPATPHRLVVGFAGTNWSGAQIRPYLNLEEGAAETIFVYPDPLTREFPGWGRLGGWQLGPHAGPAAGMEDLIFASALLDELSARYCVDEGRVFATGHSWGGDMAAVVGCFLGDRVRAVAPVAANRPYWFEPAGGGDPGCVGSPSVWTWFGVADSHFTGQDYPAQYGDEQDAFWAGARGCGEGARDLALGGDGECVERDGCAAQTRYCRYGAASGHQAPAYYADEARRWFQSF